MAIVSKAFRPYGSGVGELCVGDWSAAGSACSIDGPIDIGVICAPPCLRSTEGRVRAYESSLTP